MKNTKKRKIAEKEHVTEYLDVILVFFMYFGLKTHWKNIGKKIFNSFSIPKRYIWHTKYDTIQRDVYSDKMQLISAQKIRDQRPSKTKIDETHRFSASILIDQCTMWSNPIWSIFLWSTTLSKKVCFDWSKMVNRLIWYVFREKKFNLFVCLVFVRSKYLLFMYNNCSTTTSIIRHYITIYWIKFGFFLNFLIIFFCVKNTISSS